MTTSGSRPAPAAELPTGRTRDARGALAAVALHVLLVLLALAGAQAAAERIAESSRDEDFLSSLRGGGGGGGPRAVYIGPAPSTRSAPAARPAPLPEAQPVPPRPVEPRVPERVPEPTVPAAPPAAPPAATAAADGGGGGGTGTGGGTGSGVGSGTGSGVGAGTGTGTGGGTGDGPVRAPIWRAGALPFEAPPKDLRGRTVAVTFWVRADGRVERIEVAPPLPEGEYARRFEETLLGYRFQPARTAAGAAVAATTTLDIQLPSK